ncbi:hypothetical protein [Saccharothrix sp. HUAS TT1]|uniref:hypothetical protein n=1 Tax=unclassified Saccharothrix TaxID=2593673 RepID=UPI00345C6189
MKNQSSHPPLAALQGESSLACLEKGRREGTFVYYSAANAHVKSLLAQALFHADDAEKEVAHHER